MHSLGLRIDFLAVLLNLFFLYFVQVNPQRTPYLSLRGVLLANNSYVEFSSIEQSSFTALRCNTPLRNCCTTPLGELGNWFFPNESRVLSPMSNNYIYQRREVQRVELHRARGTSPTGIYCCAIPYIQILSQREALCGTVQQ